MEFLSVEPLIFELFIFIMLKFCRGFNLKRCGLFDNLPSAMIDGFVNFCNSVGGTLILVIYILFKLNNTLCVQIC